MTKEQESKNPILNLLGNKFSGHIQFDTDEGPVQIHFRSGRIVPTPVTENTDDTNKVKELSPKQKLAKQKLDEFIDKLPKQDTTRDSVQNVGWITRWDFEQNKYGDDSIMTMFPRNIGKKTKFLTRFLNSLRRCDKGIYTKDDLMNAPNNPLDFYNGIGEKSIKLIGILKDVIRAENE